MKKLIFLLVSLWTPLLPAISAAQIPVDKNAQGVSMGHIHLMVPDLQQARQMWLDFGAWEVSSGRLRMMAIPGIYILLTEREPQAASRDTPANHFGMHIKDYQGMHAKLEALGANFIIDDAEQGWMLADLPDGLRLEMQAVEAQEAPMVFHHMHLFSADVDALRDWYVEVFGAEPGSRSNLPSALLPGGRIDFRPDERELQPSQGSAIDHIGFEVDNMALFAARLKKLGIKFDREPQRIDAINLSIAFITDPVGTYIEITEGLDEAE